MNPYANYFAQLALARELAGALICIALAVLLLAIGRVVYELLRDLIREARMGRRLVRAAGGEGPALAMVEMLEEDTAARVGRAWMRGEQR